MNGKYQVDSGRVVASAHDMPFIANTIIPENSDLSTENDKKYLEAVKNGDMATAQAMAEQAAREKEAEQAIQGLLRCVNSR